MITNEHSYLAKIDSYIGMIKTWVSENELMDLSIDVSFEFESTHFKTSVQEEIKKLDKIVQSNFSIENEEDILSLLVSMAEGKSILKNDYLQKVIDFVSNAKSKGHEFADEFLNIVFGDFIAVRANRLTFNIFRKDMEIANISGHVTKICQKAFYGFKCLTKVFISNSVKLIGDEAFDSCSSLIFVNLPESIEQTCLGSGVFKNCTKLNYIKTPSKLTKIFDQTFKGDVSLTKVILNEGLLEIGKEAFAGCKSLEIIEIPQTVEFIDDKAFDGCENLKTVLLRGKKIELGKKVWSRKVHVVHI